MNSLQKSSVIGLTLAICTFSLSTLAEQKPMQINKQMANPTSTMQVQLPKIEEATLATPKAKAEKEIKKAHSYKISFNKNSKKKPNLEEVTIKGQLFKNGSPYKRFKLKTDDNGEFFFEKNLGKGLTVALYYIEGQEKLKVRCSGHAAFGKNEVKVSCR